MLLNGFQGLSLDGLHAPPLGPLHPQLPQFQAPAAAQRPLAGGAGPSAAAEVLPVGVGAYAQPVAAIGGSIPHGGMPGMLHLPQPPGIAQLQQLQLLQQQLGRGGRKGHQQQDQEKIRRTVYVCDIDQQASGVGCGAGGSSMLVWRWERQGAARRLAACRCGWLGLRRAWG